MYVLSIGKYTPNHELEPNHERSNVTFYKYLTTNKI